MDRGCGWHEKRSGRCRLVVQGTKDGDCMSVLGRWRVQRGVGHRTLFDGNEGKNQHCWWWSKQGDEDEDGEEGRWEEKKGRWEIFHTSYLKINTFSLFQETNFTEFLKKDVNIILQCEMVLSISRYINHRGNEWFR